MLYTKRELSVPVVHIDLCFVYFFNTGRDNMFSLNTG